MLKKLKTFWKINIWKVSIENKPKVVVFLIKLARIILVSFKYLQKESIWHRSSALTFFSLLSIVPLIAMLFGIAKGFHLDKELKKRIIETAGNNMDIWNKVIIFSENLLDNTKGGIVAGIGIIVLLWTVMKLFMNIESIFNLIWQIRSNRTWVRKFTDYFSIILITPILFILSSSLTIYIKTQLIELTHSFSILGIFGPLLKLGFQFLPYIIISISFSVLYVVMPNTKVHYYSALIGGIVSGILFQFFQNLYFYFQASMSNYNAIYGSFAALPLFLIWMQNSWLIILLGAKVAFTHQNIKNIEQQYEQIKINNFNKKIISIAILIELYKAYKYDNGRRNILELSNTISIPIIVLKDVLYFLIEAQLIIEFSVSKEKESNYILCRDIEDKTIQNLFNLFDEVGDDLFINRKDKLYQIKKKVEYFTRDELQSQNNLKIINLLNQIE